MSESDRASAFLYYDLAMADRDELLGKGVFGRECRVVTYNGVSKVDTKATAFLSAESNLVSSEKSANTYESHKYCPLSAAAISACTA